MIVSEPVRRGAGLLFRLSADTERGGIVSFLELLPWVRQHAPAYVDDVARTVQDERRHHAMHDAMARDLGCLELPTAVRWPGALSLTTDPVWNLVAIQLYESKSLAELRVYRHRLRGLGLLAEAEVYDLTYQDERRHVALGLALCAGARPSRCLIETVGRAIDALGALDRKTHYELMAVFGVAGPRPDAGARAARHLIRQLDRRT
jgi:hypothetical protein